LRALFFRSPTTNTQNASPPENIIVIIIITNTHQPRPTRHTTTRQHTRNTQHATTQDGTCGTIIETSTHPETYGRTDWVVGYNALIYWYTAFDYGGGPGGGGGSGRARVGFSRLAKKYAIDGFWLSP
jgi:hypothetical protein